MNMMTDAQLLEEVERFLAQTNMPPTRFGKLVMADGALVQHLKGGRSLSLSNANKVVGFMRAYRPEAKPRRTRTSEVAA